jgi:hypothetical protein
MLTPLPTQDYTVLARKYVRLAEDPANALYREQFLDLARVWMEVVMEEESNRSTPPNYRLKSHLDLSPSSRPRAVIALLKPSFGNNKTATIAFMD